MMHNRKDMGDEALEFINRWLYDIQRVLEVRLEALKDDLRSDDGPIADQAANEASMILDWLFPPSPPLSKEEQLKRATAAISDGKLSVEQRIAAVVKAGRSTHYRRGRPRNETTQLAIRALTLHLGTCLSWREIALAVRGCKHKRPNRERSCEACGESIRQAAIRLQQFLLSIGYNPDFPRGVELDLASKSELERLWQVTK
jgi:hypothetical protein